MLFRKDGYEWNACVGNNGYQDDWKYSDGYYQISNIAVKYLAYDKINIDSLVYPIIFCARHSIELFIKEGIRKVNGIRNIYGEKEVNSFIISTHSIVEIWERFVDIAKKTDRRFIASIMLISKAIYEIEGLDSEGQTFRYSSDTNGRLNLDKQGVIDLLNFENEYNKVFDVFNKIRGIYYYLKEEYYSGTYTKNLSRRDLEIISKSLPLYKEWHNKTEYISKFEKIRTKYKISCAELKAAINIIKNHQQFKENIEFNINNINISKKDIIVIFYYNKLYREEHRSSEGLLVPSENVIEKWKKQKEDVERIKKKYINILNQI